MGPHSFFRLNYYFDLGIKGAIAIIMGISGWFLKLTVEKVENIQDKTAMHDQKIAVLEEGKGHLARQLDRIEAKLDRVVEK